MTTIIVLENTGGFHAVNNFFLLDDAALVIKTGGEGVTGAVSLFKKPAGGIIKPLCDKPGPYFITTEQASPVVNITDKTLGIAHIIYRF